MITDIARNEIKSYRQLPLNFYQIQTKFRDEIRPRFGVMRAREFVMKDAYSFHATYADLEREYRNMYDTYTRIFTRLGLKFRAVAADTGSIGGTGSHEFHVLADSGEDAIAFCPNSDYAANIELAEALAPAAARASPAPRCKRSPTPGVRTIDVAVPIAQNSAAKNRQDIAGLRRRRRAGRVAAARRSHAERNQGRETASLQAPLRPPNRSRSARGIRRRLPGRSGPSPIKTGAA